MTDDLFDSWNFQKKKINKTSRRELFFKEREVWISSVGINIETEQNGDKHNFTRPVLILRKINSSSLVVMPLSSKSKKLDFYYNFYNPFSEKVSVILGQIRFISSKRLIRKLYKLK